MNGKVVAAIIAIISLVGLLLPLFVEDVFKRDEVYKPEYLRMENIDVKAEKINDSHAEMKFLISLYRSESVKNASLIVSIYDRKTNILLERIRTEIPEKGEEGLFELNVSVALEKDKDYNIRFELRKDGRVLYTRGMALSGLETLVPKDKELKMTLKDVDFEVAGVDNRMAMIKARFYIETLENYDDVTFHIKAIQHESNVLANESWIEMQKIEKGKTLLVETVFGVPKDYNYLVKLEVWRNGAMLKTWSKGLNLAPTRTVPEDVKEEKVEFEITEFVKPTPHPTPMPTPMEEHYPVPGVAREAPGEAMPGFEIITAILAGGVILWMMRRR